MNDFATTQTSGLLKTNYDQGADPLEISLKKRREALMVSKNMLDPDKQSVEPEGMK
jgi:hypothetical protein